MDSPSRNPFGQFDFLIHINNSENYLPLLFYSRHKVIWPETIRIFRNAIKLINYQWQLISEQSIQA